MSAAYAILPAETGRVVLQTLENTNDGQSVHILEALHDVRQALDPERIIEVDTDTAAELGVVEILGDFAREKLAELLGDERLIEFYMHASEEDRRLAVQHASILLEAEEATR